MWLSTRNLPLQSLSRKLAPKFIGPFSIVMILSPMAVRLKLPHYLQRVHPVFHVTCIKPIIRPPSSPSPPSRPVLVEGSPSYRVKKLLAARPPSGKGFSVPGRLGGVRPGGEKLDPGQGHSGLLTHRGLALASLGGGVLS